MVFPIDRQFLMQFTENVKEFNILVLYYRKLGHLLKKK